MHNGHFRATFQYYLIRDSWVAMPEMIWILMHSEKMRKLEQLWSAFSSLFTLVLVFQFPLMEFHTLRGNAVGSKPVLWCTVNLSVSVWGRADTAQYDLHYQISSFVSDSKLSKLCILSLPPVVLRNKWNAKTNRNYLVENKYTMLLC